MLVWGVFIVGMVLFVLQNWVRGLPLPNLPVLRDFLTKYREPLLLGIVLWGVVAWISFQIDALKRLRNKVSFYKARFRLRPHDINPSRSWHTSYLIERNVIDEVASSLDKRKDKIGVLLLGIPLVGKTRCAYEIFKKMRGYHVLGLLSQDQDIAELRIPRSYVFRKPKIVVFLDNLEGFINKIIPNQLYLQLEKQTRSFAILATCRTGQNWTTIAQDQTFYSFVRENLLRTRVHELSKVEEHDLAERLGRAWNRTMYNGTPGSIVFDLDAMQQYLEEAGKEAITLMRTLYLMRRAGIQTYRRTFSDQLACDIFDLSADRNKLDAGWKTLSESGFLTIERGSVIPTHPVYIEGSFWSDYEELHTEEDFESLWQLVCNGDATTEILDMARNWSHHGDYERALGGYEKYLALVPDDVEARFYTAWTRLQAGQARQEEGQATEGDKIVRDAAQEFRMILQSEPNNANAHYALALALRNTNGSEREIEHELREALKSSRNFAEAHDALGDVLFFQGRLKEAEQEYFEARRCDPAFPHPHLGLHDVFRASGRAVQAYYELEAWKRLTEEGEYQAQSWLANT
jgi:tetratricopeptide (TPR) repeat protein